MTNHHTVTTINRQVSKKYINLGFLFFHSALLTFFLLFLLKSSLFYIIVVIFCIHHLLSLHFSESIYVMWQWTMERSIPNTLCSPPCVTTLCLPKPDFLLGQISGLLFYWNSKLFILGIFFVRIPFPSHSAISH